MRGAAGARGEMRQARSRWFVRGVSLMLIGAAAAMFAACGGDDGDDASTPTAAATTAATQQAAATAGAAAPPTENGYRAEQVFPQLDFQRMVLLKWMPGNDSEALVMTQSGAIYRADLASGGEPAIFLDVSDLLIGSPGNEEGLLGLAFAPDFRDSGAFYIYYTAGDPRRSVIARYAANGANAADAASAEVILEVPQPFANHNGGALEFGPDGYLYIALGDGGSAGDPQGNGQNTNTLLGSILRIDVSGESGYNLPPDNPFASGGGLGEIWAFGLRNPWRMSFDSESGELWAADVGQNGWEEVDRVVKGGNYGWNVMEGPDCYRTGECDNEGMQLPRATYPTADGCAVTGGYVYHGRAMPELNGWYIYGDYCSGRVWALDTGDDASAPVTLFDSGTSISSFAQDPGGEVYLVTFSNAIYRIARP